MTLPAPHLEAALEKPSHISPRVQALVDSWRGEPRRERELIDTALRYFRTQRFTYTLAPGTYGGDPLDEFLFQRRSGFCEHYAAAFATLMRLVDVPSRIVAGYHGGKYNEHGSYVIVSQSDSHAWCEVWIQNRGWLRVDPTNAIAPERITSGFDSFLESRTSADDAASSAGSTSAAGLRQIVRDVRLVWDSLNYQWDLRVLNYDEETQHSFFATIGFSDYDWATLATCILLPALLVLAITGLWLRRPARFRRDPAVRAYERFCRALAVAGLRREISEGPVHFGERAAAHFAGEADAIRRITDLYVRLRYSGAPPRLVELSREVRRWKPRLKARRHRIPPP